MKFLAFLLSLSPVLICFILYRKIYFRSVAAIFIPAGSSSVSVSMVRPVGSWFRSVSMGYHRGFVPLGNGFYAFYVDRPVSDLTLSWSGINFYSDVYIFRRNRLGRFISVDLSYRPLSDLLNKFSINK